jgi:molybdate transport system ATP-binding protein
VSLELDIEHRVGRFALRARFAADGRVTALFGRSGAGKTTLVNAIAGLLRPAAGRIALDGEALFDAGKRIHVPPHRRRIGYVFQEGRLFPHLDVRRNLLYGRWFTPPRRRYAEFDQIVALLGLEELLARRPGSLSGGEKQRVAIGRALLASPRLLLMDEPLAALDAARKSEILPYIERLRDERLVPIVYVSHSVGEVSRIADTLVLLSGGEVAAWGPVDEIMGRIDLRPLTGRYEAGALLEARVAGHDAGYALTELTLADGQLLRVPEIDLPVGATLRLRVRARDVAIATQPPSGTSVLNVLRGRIGEIDRNDGPIAELRLDLGGASLIARITRRSRDQLELAPGREAYALIKSIAFDRHAVGALSPPRAEDREWLTE